MLGNAKLHNIVPIADGKTAKKKTRETIPGLFDRPGGVWQVPLRNLLGESGLDRLVGIACKARIHLTELGDLGDVGVIRLLRILRLNLDGLLYRLCADELLESARAVLERLLRIIGDLGCNGLEALVHLAKRLDGRIEAVLTHFLKLFETFEHHEPSLKKNTYSVWRAIYMHCTINGQPKFLQCTISRLLWALTLWQSPDFSLLPNPVAPAGCDKARVSWVAVGMRGARPNGRRGRGENPELWTLGSPSAARLAPACACTCSRDGGPIDPGT